MRIILPSLVLAAITLSCPLLAQAKSLPETIHMAWQTHPALKAAQAGQGFALRDIKEQFAAFLPTLSLSASGGRQFANNSTSRGLNTVRGEGYSGIWDANINVRQTFFDGGGRGGRVKSARSRAEAAADILTDAQEIIAAGVSATYIELLRTYRVLSVLESHKATSQDYINRITQGVEQGAMNEGELRQAEESLLLIDAQIAEARSQLASAKAAYEEAVGSPPEGTFSTPFIAPANFPASPQMAIDTAIETHPSLARARKQAQSILHDKRSEYAAFYPTVDGELSYTQSEKRDVIGGESEDAIAKLSMNWSFNAGGAAFHRISKAEFQYQQAKAELENAERQIARAIAQSYAGYQGAIEALSVLDQRLSISQALYANYQEQFEGARISLLELMQAQGQAMRTRLEHINGQSRVLVTQYEVLAAMGRAGSIAREGAAL